MMKIPELLWPSLNRWWEASACTGFVIIFLCLTRATRKRHWFGAAAGAAYCLLALLVGCGGGSSGGGSGGGGGGGPVPTSVTMTSSIFKAPAGNPVTLSATVASTRGMGGTVTFWEQGNDGALTPPLTVVNGMVQSPVNLSLVGTHQIRAEYSGDSQNLPSKSANVNVVSTGSTYIQVTATSSSLSHYTTIWVTIQ
jgi:hypothetical protein